MMRSTIAVLACALALTACGKKDDNAGSTSSAASTAAAAATATAEPTAAATAAPTAAPADTGAPAPSGTADAPPAETAAPTSTVVTNVVPQRGIEDCCAALAAVAASGRGRSAKRSAFRAHEVCPGIAAQVRAGRATRAQALTQVRSALVGHPVPASCR